MNWAFEPRTIRLHSLFLHFILNMEPDVLMRLTQGGVHGYSSRYEIHRVASAGPLPRPTNPLPLQGWLRSQGASFWGTSVPGKYLCVQGGRGEEGVCTLPGWEQDK